MISNYIEILHCLILWSSGQKVRGSHCRLLPGTRDYSTFWRLLRVSSLTGSIARKMEALRTTKIIHVCSSCWSLEHGQFLSFRWCWLGERGRRAEKKCCLHENGLQDPVRSSGAPSHSCLRHRLRRYGQRTTTVQQQPNCYLLGRIHLYCRW